MVVDVENPRLGAFHRCWRITQGSGGDKQLTEFRLPSRCRIFFVDINTLPAAYLKSEHFQEELKMVFKRTPHIAGAFFALVLFALVASSAHATVIWDLNPSPRQNGPTGQTSIVYTSDGHSITAYGFDNSGGFGTPHELYFKNVGEIGGAVEF